MNFKTKIFIKYDFNNYFRNNNNDNVSITMKKLKI